MLAFRRSRDLAVCDFETAELDLLESLLGQLIELLLDQGTGLFGPGTRPLPADTAGPGEDILARLERELDPGSGQFELQPVVDPVLKRLYPDAYPADPAASHDFQRFTQAAQRDDKVGCAQRMLSDLRIARADSGHCTVPSAHTIAWLKSLTNMRLALAVRMGIETAEDAEELAELPDDDPRSWVYSIYEWTGWVQESLLAVQD